MALQCHEKYAFSSSFFVVQYTTLANAEPDALPKCDGREPDLSFQHDPASKLRIVPAVPCKHLDETWRARHRPDFRALSCASVAWPHRTSDSGSANINPVPQSGTPHPISEVTTMRRATTALIAELPKLIFRSVAGHQQNDVLRKKC